MRQQYIFHRSTRSGKRASSKLRSHGVNHDRWSTRISAEHISRARARTHSSIRAESTSKSGETTADAPAMSSELLLRWARETHVSYPTRANLLRLVFLVSRFFFSFKLLLSQWRRPTGRDESRTFMHTWTTVGERLLPLLWSTTTWTFEVPCTVRLCLACVCIHAWASTQAKRARASSANTRSFLDPINRLTNYTQ